MLLCIDMTILVVVDGRIFLVSIVTLGNSRDGFLLR